MFCRNCGKETQTNNQYCMSCGARPLAGTAFCPACAGATTPASEICVKCGSKLARPIPVGAAITTRTAKSKLASILLAVFLGFWTWLYTYKKDGWKFWTGLGVSFVAFIGLSVFFAAWVIQGIGESANFTDSSLLALGLIYAAGTIIGTGVWIWGIVDTAIKKNEWYDNYPDK
jgi:hypothetical protein